MSGREPVAVRLYRGLLRLLPTAFRRRHGDEMARTFASIYRQGRRRGRLAAAGATVRELRDLFRVLRQERGSAGGPRRWLDDLRADAVYSLRQLRRAPVSSAVIIVILAVGIGANTAVFSIADALLLRPLPLPDADRLVSVSSLYEQDRFAAAGRDLAEWARADSFAAAGGAWRRARTLTLGDRPRRVTVGAVTPGYLDALGMEPRIGRRFGREDVDGEAAPLAILGHHLWIDAFGGEEVLGSDLEIDGRAHRVIGVMPPGFDLPDATDLWVPLSLDEVVSQRPSSRDFDFVGRLRDGASLERLQGELDAIAARLAREHPESHDGWDVWTAPLRRVLLQDQDGRIGTAVGLLSGSVAFLLLLTCANVASLLLARLAGRGDELSLRAALGAGRGRMVRQLLTESLVISALGGAGGLLLATWSLPVLVGQAPLRGDALGGALLDIRVDLRVVATTGLVVLITGLGLGLVAALRASRQDPAPLLDSASRGAVGSAREHRIMDGLLVAEVALAISLTVGAGLTARSLANLQRIDLGFEADDRLVVHLDLPMPAYEEATARRQLIHRVLERVRALPGVVAAGATTNVPLEGDSWDSAYFPRNGVRPDEGEFFLAADRAVTPGYLETLGVELVAGRLLDERDGPDAEPVAVVTADMARHAWPGEDPLGKLARRNQNGAWRTVVGVVAPVREDRGAFRRDRPAWYVPYDQIDDRREPRLLVEHRRDADALASALTAAVTAVDPTIPVYRVRPLADLAADLRGSDRFSALVTAAFASIGVLLAALGIYGVLAFRVARRVREIGLRMALGADAGRVVRAAVARGAALVAAGLAVGLVAAVGLSRALSSLFFQVPALDPLVLGGASALLLVVATVAAWLPAWRATRVDPVEALRAR